MNNAWWQGHGKPQKTDHLLICWLRWLVQPLLLLQPQQHACRC
jgi:hypothetical protein